MDKLRSENYPRMDGRHAAWFPWLRVLLTAWVALGSLSFHELQLFRAHLKSVRKMPPPIVSLSNKPHLGKAYCGPTDVEDLGSQTRLPNMADPYKKL